MKIFKNEFTTKEVCDKLKIKPYHLDYLLNIGLITEPKTISNRRFYNKKQIKEIKYVLEKYGYGKRKERYNNEL